MSGFNVGDRVRVKPHVAASYVRPVSEWIKASRPATVQVPILRGGKVRVIFDRGRLKTYDLTAWFRPDELERIEGPQ